MSTAVRSEAHDLEYELAAALEGEVRFGHGDRALYASKLVTKCPSKYEAKGLGKDKS